MNITKLILTAALALTLTSCDDQHKAHAKPALNALNPIPDSSKEISKSKITIEGNQELLPEFKAIIHLDSELFKVLRSKKESVIADYYFYGNIEPDTELPQEVQQEMDLYGLRLGKGKLEITDITEPTITFDFKNMKIPVKLYNYLSDKVIRLNINFYSGRKAFEDNILDVDAFDSALSDILNENGKVTYTAKLLKQKTNEK